MARGERKGFVARWLEGKERSEEYARSTLPSSRWALFWDILKGRFWKLILTNLLVLVTFLPVIALLVFRWMSIAGEGLGHDFGSGMGIGYPALPDITGAAQSLIFQTDLIVFGLMIPAMAVAALGISGGMYIIRNMIWTEGIFFANDFVRGIKRNYWNVFEAVMIFSVMLFLSVTMGDLADMLVAVGAPHAGWMVASKVIGYVFIALAILICMWMISLGVNYKQGPWQLFRNAVVLAFGTFPQTVFFAACALWPVFLTLFSSQYVMIAGMILIVFLAFAYAMLVWMDYCQWAFDKFINPNMGFATGKGLYDKNKKSTDSRVDTGIESEAMREYKRQIVAQGKSKLVCRPIKPIDDDLEIYQLPDSFSREDLQRLKESKQKVVDDVEAYEEEHKNDEQFVEYNKQFEEQEKALQAEEDKGKKKKKVKRPEMLNKRKK